MTGEFLNCSSAFLYSFVLMISIVQMDENIFCPKLRMLRKDVIAGKKLSTLRNRIQFTTSQHKRSKYLKKLTKYNERLRRILEGTSETEVAEIDLRRKSLSPKIRAIAHRIHDALSRSWACKCKTLHEELFEAKFCLTRNPNFKNSFEHSFNILFVTLPDSPLVELNTWQESIIHTTPTFQGYEPRAFAVLHSLQYFCSLP